MSDLNERFCTKVRDRTFVKGTFVKIADPSVIEMLAMFDLDFVVIDAEHAPLGRQQIASLLIAASAARIAAVVRIPEKSGYWISTALDCGAAGIMVPHVSCVDEARRLAALIGFGVGGRGFSPSTRAAGYGARGIESHLQRSPGESVLMCQIEDKNGVANAQEISAVDGVDCLFIGPVDLAVSAGKSAASDPEIKALCERVMAACDVSGTASGLFVPDLGSASAWQKKGASVMVIGTDQAFLRAGAKASLS